ncbi:MAG: TonB-dependent receptor [Sphingomonadales bacterium]|nr:MAG: TonB-dependent receptor [Sphingomonadales bacterium]
MKAISKIMAAPLVIAIAASAAPAFAQTAPNDEKALAEEPVQHASEDMDDIVVTARRREERLQDVPIAITALSAGSLAEANIVQVSDLPMKVPGLTTQPSAFGSNVLQVSIRGQRQFDPYITKDPAVAVYFADVVQNRPQGLNSAFFDVSSVQVLKGPQGTLFGRNTTGGAMLITPQAPTDQFEGYLLGGYGNYNAYRVEGAVNVPLADWAKLRVAGAIQRRDGFTNNVTTGQQLDDENKNNWRVSLTLSPAQGFENRTVINGFSADENGVGYKLLGVLPGVGFGSAPNVVAELARVNALPFHSTTSDQILETRVKTFAVSNVTTIDIADNVTLKNIAGYRFVGSHIPFDLDGSSLTFTDGANKVVPFFPSREDMTVRQYSDELQILGTVFGGSLDYIFGGFYFLERGSDRQQSGGQGGVSVGGIYQGDRVTYADPIRNQSYSGFAQFTWRPAFLQGFSVTAGGRQTHDLREITTRNLVSNGTCRLVNSSGAVLNPCVTSYSKSFDKFTYSLSADYKIAQGVLVYLAHRTGYRTGGFNISATTPAQFTPFQPENLSDYEVGIKTDFRMGTGKGRLNVAAYTQDYRNIQRNQGALINGVFTQTIVNAAEATIKGFEVELQLQPVDFIDFGLNVANIDARYRNWTANGVNLSGSQFAGTPAWTIGANFGFRIPLGEAGELSPRIDLFHQTDTNMSDNNYFVAQSRISPTSIMPAYTLVNARIDLRNIGGSGIDAGLWAKNLLDAEYIASGTELANTGLGYTAGFVGAPRTYGVELRFAF